MTLPDLHIDGKRVTPRNASRFVKARYPSARIYSESNGPWSHHRRSWIVTGGINGHGNTAGEAWLNAARHMIENAVKEAARKSALAAVSEALSRAALAAVSEALSRAAGPEREAAALRYAAERLRQHTDSYRVREAIPILEAAALRYAAERLRQHTDSYRVREAIPILEAMAATGSPGSGGKTSE